MTDQKQDTVAQTEVLPDERISNAFVAMQDAMNDYKHAMDDMRTAEKEIERSLEKISTLSVRIADEIKELNANLLADIGGQVGSILAEF